MKLVLDSSVAFKWLVPEDGTDKAIRLRDDFQSQVHELLSPNLFPIQVADAKNSEQETAALCAAGWRLRLPEDAEIETADLVEAVRHFNHLLSAEIVSPDEWTQEAERVIAGSTLLA